MKIEEVVITTEYIRLDAFLKFCGAAETGGRAKEMILAGTVSADGEICFARGKKLRQGACVRVEEAEYKVVAP